ncbi:hypothetical protein TrRE_jg5151, partial [Triparma retinervis]
EKDEVAKAAAAKLSKQKSMMMGFFKKPSPKKTDQMTVEKDGIEVVGKGKGEEEVKVMKGKPNKNTMSDEESEKFWKVLNVKDSVNSLNLTTTKPKGRGKFVPVNVMATVFPPGADPSNPFSIAQPYTEPKTVKLWNRKKFLMFEEDERPPYRGTWSKKSVRVAGRRPFAKDAEILNYDYDSEAEWEEEEPGEDIEEDKEEDIGEEDEGEKYDYEDGWMCGDDDLGQEDDNAAEAEIRKRNVADDDNIFKEKIIISCLPGGIPRKFGEGDKSEAAVVMDSCGLVSLDGSIKVDLSLFPVKGGVRAGGEGKSNGITAQMMPAFLDFVHNNSCKSKDTLVNDYLARDDLFDGLERPSKKQVAGSIASLAEKVKLGAGAVVWRVKGRELEVEKNGGLAGMAIGGTGNVFAGSSA